MLDEPTRAVNAAISSVFIIFSKVLQVGPFKEAVDSWSVSPWKNRL